MPGPVRHGASESFEAARPVSTGWMITFADLLSLLLTFFVLLFAMGNVKPDAWNALVQALAERMGPSAAWTDPDRTRERNVTRVFEARAYDLDYVASILADDLAREALLAGIEPERLDDRLRLSLPARSLFATNTAELDAAAGPAIAALARALQHVGNAVEVWGHTGPTFDAEASPFASNWELSLARALTLAAALNAAGYPHAIRGFGRADARYYERAGPVGPDGQRIDLVIRSTPAKEQTNGP